MLGYPSISVWLHGNVRQMKIPSDTFAQIFFLSFGWGRNFFENRVSGLVPNSGSLSDFWSPGYIWLRTHLFQCGPGVRHCCYWNSLGNWSSRSITVLPAPKYRAMGRKCVSSLSSPNLWWSWLSWAPLWRSFAWWHLSMLELSDLQNQDLLTLE